MCLSFKLIGLYYVCRIYRRAMEVERLKLALFSRFSSGHVRAVVRVDGCDYILFLFVGMGRTLFFAFL